VTERVLSNSRQASPVDGPETLKIADSFLPMGDNNATANFPDEMVICQKFSSFRQQCVESTSGCRNVQICWFGRSRVLPVHQNVKERDSKIMMSYRFDGSGGLEVGYVGGLLRRDRCNQSRTP
jgi:hypothetical protein